MKKFKSILGYIVPKLIFTLALLNFLYIYSKTPKLFQSAGKISFYNLEWYETYKFVDVLTLLFAALLLLVGRKWSYLLAGLLSGIIVIQGFIQCFRVNLIEVWKYVQRNNLDIFSQWEIQFLVALFIFVTAIFYLKKELKNNANLR